MTIARVEARLREVLEARLERGEQLNPTSYGFYFSESRIQDTIADCGACLLGSVVLEELTRGPLPSCNGTPDGLAARVLHISLTKANALEAGFMAWDDKYKSPWFALGRKLRLDYYETK